MLSNKAITSSQNGIAAQPNDGKNPPIGSMPLAQAIYGPSTSNNRNYRAHKTKHAGEDKRQGLQSKRSLAHQNSSAH